MLFSFFPLFLFYYFLCVLFFNFFVFPDVPCSGFYRRPKSQGDSQKSYEELGIFGGLRLNKFVSSPSADHYFWCSGGVPGCFEGVPGYYGMSQWCSGGVPGFTDTPGEAFRPDFLDSELVAARI